MPKISILTPTIRPDGLEIIAKALKKQTFQDFEWLIGSPFNPVIEKATWNEDENHWTQNNLATRTIKWVQDDFEGGFWSLNRIYNKLFKEAKGEILVSWQDWVYANPDALEKFVENVGKTNGVVSGVGDQYESVNKWGKPQIKIWSDPRKTNKYGSFYECNPNDAEWNFCAFPKEAIIEVGGMDEELDFLGYGGDQLQVGERMDACGIKFFLDQTNESFTVRHDRSDFGGQESWDKNHVLFNGQYDKRKQALKESGQWPKLSS